LFCTAKKRHYDGAAKTKISPGAADMMTGIMVETGILYL
jgi:hypothetical protein